MTATLAAATTTRQSRRSNSDDFTHPPGTVQLVDSHPIFNGPQRLGTAKEIVLTPWPSNDASDPLNWSQLRKASVIAAMCSYTLSVGNASAAIYSVFGQISTETGLGLDELNAGTGYMFLAFGWGCLLWQPLALQYGKRPMYLLSLLGTIATQVWTPFVTANSHWILSKVLQGFFGAPIESLCQISIADVHFQHKRGRYIGLYTLSLGGSSTLAPFFAGLVSERQTWKWVPYLASILCAFSFVVCLLLMEETNYDRARDLKREVEHSQSRTEVGTHSAGEVRIRVSELHPRTGPPISPQQSFLNRYRIFWTGDFGKSGQFRDLARRALAPIIFLRLPIVVYAGFLYGSHLVWTNLLNGTVAYVLGQPPYNFRPSSIGLSYLAAFVGVACGCLYTGWLGDKFAMWMAKRNHGVYEPEQRLWLLMPSVVSVPCGLALWGVGAAQGLHWSACVFAMGLMSFGNSAGMQVAMCYCMESYRERSAETMVAVMLIRNSMSFAAGYGITPWVRNMGLKDAFTVASCVAGVQCLTFLLFVRHGKDFRIKSATFYKQYAG